MCSVWLCPSSNGLGQFFDACRGSRLPGSLAHFESIWVELHMVHGFPYDGPSQLTHPVGEMRIKSSIVTVYIYKERVVYLLLATAFLAPLLTFHSTSLHGW